jgi:hypothetical protein
MRQDTVRRGHPAAGARRVPAEQLDIMYIIGSMRSGLGAWPSLDHHDRRGAPLDKITRITPTMRCLSVAKSLWLIRAEPSVLTLRATRIFCVEQMQRSTGRRRRRIGRFRRGEDSPQDRTSGIGGRRVG